MEMVEYFEKLNIPVLSIGKVKTLIKRNIFLTDNAWKNGINVERQCFHIIGPAGIGKTDICKQVVQELSEELSIKFELIMVKAPVLSRDDFIIPFPVDKKKFEMLYSNFVPDDKDSYGLFVIDEFSRGDHQLQQLLWQIQNEYKIHLLDFPKNWYVVTIDNPDTSEYILDTMEDAAGLRRQLHLYVEVNVHDFLNYANSKQFHKSIISFINIYPQYLYDFDAQKQGMVFANPASYEKLSDHLKKYELVGSIRNHIDEIEYLTAGLLNSSLSSIFINFLLENSDVIKPEDIFYKYDTIRKKILELKKSNDNSSLSTIMISFTSFLSSSKPQLFDHTQVNIVNFLTDIPEDTAALFASYIETLKRNSKEFLYFANMNRDLIKKFEKYKTLFYEVMSKHAKGAL